MNPPVGFRHCLLGGEAVKDLGIGELGKLGREYVHQCLPKGLGMVVVEYV